MHQSAIVAETLHAAYEWGFAEERLKPDHFWNRLVQNIQNVIKGSNFTYRVALRNSKVKYINAYGSFEDDHKIKVTIIINYMFSFCFFYLLIVFSYLDSLQIKLVMNLI